MASNLTPSLEDYLESIYLLQRDGEQVRVRDIAKERNVKASSVSPALKRLAELGYIHYEQREEIALTDAGLVEARRVYARHVMLFQFFKDILGMNEETAKAEACGLEHALSDEGMDRFVRYFEMISICPFDKGVCRNPRIIAPVPQRLSKLGDHKPACEFCSHQHESYTTLLDAPTDKVLRILQIRAKGAMRKKLLETGLLPNVEIQKESANAKGVSIRYESSSIKLTKAQAEAIIVTS